MYVHLAVADVDARYSLVYCVLTYKVHPFSPTLKIRAINKRFKMAATEIEMNDVAKVTNGANPEATESSVNDDASASASPLPVSSSTPPKKKKKAPKPKKRKPKVDKPQAPVPPVDGGDGVTSAANVNNNVNAKTNGIPNGNETATASYRNVVNAAAASGGGDDDDVTQQAHKQIAEDVDTSVESEPDVTGVEAGNATDDDATVDGHTKHANHVTQSSINGNDVKADTDDDDDDEPREQTPLLDAAQSHDGTASDVTADADTQDDDVGKRWSTAEREARDRLAAWFDALAQGDRSALTWLMESGQSVNEQDEVMTMMMMMM